MTASNELMDAWRPDCLASGASEALLAVARECNTVDDGLDQGLVNGETLCGEVFVGILSSRSAVPHVDRDSPPWSALWVLQAGKGHRLSMADHVPNATSGIGRIPPTKPHVHSELEPGVVVLFNAHRLHWLKPAEDKGMLVVASLDFHERPTREEVEEQIEGIVRGYELAGVAPSPLRLTPGGESKKGRGLTRGLSCCPTTAS